jgi:hypothetical protein
MTSIMEAEDDGKEYVAQEMEHLGRKGKLVDLSTVLGEQEAEDILIRLSVLETFTEKTNGTLPGTVYLLIAQPINSTFC